MGERFCGRFVLFCGNIAMREDCSFWKKRWKHGTSGSDGKHTGTGTLGFLGYKDGFVIRGESKRGKNWEGCRN
jgi:hypothetical protein